jgi:hypothetical protein
MLHVRLLFVHRLVNSTHPQVGEQPQMFCGVGRQL